MCYITLIDLWILKNPCIPGINPTWSWCMILLMYGWVQFASILLKIFVPIFIGILACNFIFFCGIFVWFWYQGDWQPLRMNLGVFLPLQFLGIVSEGQVTFSKFARTQLWSQAIWSQIFVGSVFLLSFNFSTCDWSFIFSISYLFSPGGLYLSKNLSISSRVSISLVYNCL